MGIRRRLVAIAVGVMVGPGLGRAQPGATPAPAPTASTPTIELHGIIGGSLYGQDAALGPFAGGGAWFVTGVPARDPWSLGGDVRQTRLNLAAVGPPVAGGVTPRGVLELDLFGGPGPGGYGDVSVVPRLRLAYAELRAGRSTLQVGQNTSLVLALVPVTVGHAAYPLSIAAGTIGWRYPGVFALHAVPLGGRRGTLEFGVMLARPAWQNPAAAPASDALVSQDAMGIGLGEASGLPQVEVRLKLTRPGLDAFVAGHVHRVDRTGTGATTGPQIDLTVRAAVAGAKLVAGRVTVAGAGYVGQNLAPLLGGLLQFQGPTRGDVREWGGWAQAVVAVGPRTSLGALAGTARLRSSDAAAAELARRHNTVVSALARYQLGGYAVGLEVTRWRTARATDAGVVTLTGDQLMASAMYTF